MGNLLYGLRGERERTTNHLLMWMFGGTRHGQPTDGVDGAMRAFPGCTRDAEALESWQSACAVRSADGQIVGALVVGTQADLAVRREAHAAQVFAQECDQAAIAARRARETWTQAWADRLDQATAGVPGVSWQSLATHACWASYEQPRLATGFLSADVARQATSAVKAAFPGLRVRQADSRGKVELRVYWADLETLEQAAAHPPVVA